MYDTMIAILYFIWTIPACAIVASMYIETMDRRAYAWLMDGSRYDLTQLIMARYGYYFAMPRVGDASPRRVVQLTHTTDDFSVLIHTHKVKKFLIRNMYNMNQESVNSFIETAPSHRIERKK